MVTTRDALRQATQARVLDEAGRLFLAQGFDATTIRSIADACGVSVGTVMAAGDKNDLLAQVFDSLIGAEHARREAVVAERQSIVQVVEHRAVVDRVLDLVQPFVVLFTDQQDLARSYVSIVISGKHSSTLFTDLAVQLIAEFTAAMHELDSVHAERLEIEAKARALYFAYVGTLFMWTARSTADPTELNASLRSTFAAICGDSV